MSFEALPNEILSDLFEFLKTSELANTFCYRNHRFDDLLLNHFYKYGLDFRSTHKKNFDFICQQQLPLIASEIPALCLSDDDETPYQSKVFFDNDFILNQFTSLKSLSIYGIRSSETLDVFVNGLSHLLNLTNLKLIGCHVDKVQPSCQTILNKIWCLPKLAQLHFDVSFQYDKCLACIKTPSSSIKHLTIEGIRCCLFELSKLFECTQNLEYISIYSEDND